ncbi:Kunitz/Bovine pancreatic trypsin inhibitor domain protein [Necator americanus]|uniref:Kunitz/Bovine pancreatic trypsin inhibitor domain protein n=1 Tax=Necator americanus TaxID=51031 RepID=W2TXC4_NECAM|nr:Kunitz/Bovine pancreatic trypsin inhibitor domain protein [Necator americanus]ETN86740.1 Kunitz/Bovine pancreatic trypsin inhibitor domain protein [Necator americanus]
MKFLLFLLLGLFAGASGQGYDRSGDICNMKEDEGPCKSLQTRWRWDFNEGNCVKFNYGGCGGNKNNFETEEKCLERCTFAVTELKKGCQELLRRRFDLVQKQEKNGN